MPTYSFRGQMLPRVVEFSLPQRLRLNLNDTDLDQSVEFVATVEKNDVRIDCTIRKDSPTAMKALTFWAVDLARTLADLECLRTGVSFVASIEDLHLPDSTVAPVILGDRRLAGIIQSAVDRFGFEALREEALTDTDVARLVSDVAVMLAWPHYAPIAAGRVTDSIVHLISGGHSASDWQNMRTVLRVDRSYLQPLTNESVAPRHGDRRFVSGETNRTNAERAWVLMQRFLTYRLSGGQPLDATEFQVLHG